MKTIHFIIALILFLGNGIQAQVDVASIFSDNMVLQQNTKIPVWGVAKTGEAVTVKFHNQTKKTITDKNGKWSVYLDNEKAGGPFILSIKGKTKIEIKNILVGEVWLCSGQSNMEFIIEQANDAKNEIAKANFPLIRHIKIPKEINPIGQTEFKKSNWEVCSPETVANFTAVGYFFARELNRKNHVPIGLINATWGGTNIETWISREGFESSPEFKEMIAHMKNVDLNSLLDLKMVAAKKRVESLQKTKFTTDKVPFYKDLNFDDSAWLTLQQPGAWEEQSLGNFDGVVWLRKHFTVTEISKSALLDIPGVDDNDITYVNGIKVGESEGWDTKRSYKIPSEILKIGDNVIAVRVTDNGGGGGIYGNADLLKLTTENSQIPLAGTWKFQVEEIKNDLNENEFPSLCYNAMINPLIPFAFKGVLWYQGETNAPRAFQYKTAFPLLINDWRLKFKFDFPFYFVQLASYETKGNSNEGCDWAELREAQTNTLKVKNTGMVVTTDLVTDPKDIHPKNKLDIGKRLAAVALTNLYNQKMVCNGPTYKSFENSNGKSILSFENIGSGLSSKNSSNFVSGFEVAGNDKVFYPAKGILLSENKNGKEVYTKVSLTSDKVANPVAFRFGWIGDTSECNLFNNEGFPAIPFRTDDWKLNTEDIKYKLN